MIYANSPKEAGDYLKTHYNFDKFLEGYLPKAKDGKTFVCPKCGHGGRKNPQGISNNWEYHELWKCQDTECEWCGDIFEIIQLKENISFNEALNKIASWCGEEIKYNNSGEYKNKSQMINNTVNNEQTERQIRSEREQKEQWGYNCNAEIIAESQKNFSKFCPAMDYLCNKRGFDRDKIFPICLKKGFGYIEKTPEKYRKYLKYINHALIIPTSPDPSKPTFTWRNSIEWEKEEDKGKAIKGNGFNTPHFGNEILLQDIITNNTKADGDRLFICEGGMDSLSLEEFELQSISLNSANYADRFIEMILSNIESFKDFVFLLALDSDEAGKKATNKILKEFKENDIKVFDIRSYIVSFDGKIYKDVNEAFTANKAKFEQRIFDIYINPEMDIKRTLYKENSSTNKLLELLASYETKRPKAISTGFEKLDSALYGGFYSGLYILGAVSSLGKTSFALQIASNIAEAGKDVIIFSLEMSSQELLAKVISRFTFEINRDYPRNTIEILNNYIEDEYKPTRSKAFERLQKFSDRIYISEGIGNITTEQIREKIKEHIDITGNVPFVVIDYVQIIAPFDYKMTDKQATDRNIIELKRISRDYNLTILGISSFNRESYKEEVSLTSFKESGAIEYGSDVLMGMQYKELERKETFSPSKGTGMESDKEYNARKQLFYKELEEKRAKGEFIPLQIKILKNRNGKTSKVDFYFKPPYNYFTDDEVTKKKMEK